MVGGRFFFCDMPYIYLQRIQDSIDVAGSSCWHKQSVLWTVVLSWHEFQDVRIIACSL